MTFQRARTEEQITHRQETILSHAQRIYIEEGLAAVTFTNISKHTNFTRQTIYTYYQTKEEILLDLLKHHYQKFMTKLKDDLDANKHLTRESFARLLTDRLLEKPVMLSLFSILYSVLEVNVSYERLLAFKRKIFHSFDLFKSCLKQIYQGYSEEELELFCYHFMIYISSLYPITHPSQNQLKAIKEIGVPLSMLDQEKIYYSGLRRLL